jgi:hypothetical protein
MMRFLIAATVFFSVSVFATHEGAYVIERPGVSGRVILQRAAPNVLKLLDFEYGGATHCNLDKHLLIVRRGEAYIGDPNAGHMKFEFRNQSLKVTQRSGPYGSICPEGLPPNLEFNKVTVRE